MPAAEGSLPPHDLGRLIEVLERHRVDYLLAGGAAARAYGATRLTEDADCVVERSRANLDRLAAGLRELNARLRIAGLTLPCVGDAEIAGSIAAFPLPTPRKSAESRHKVSHRSVR